ncbi:hypothetical protein HYALB_00002470 [Hymenoscyphus albidus]|uniref:Uncharacterized protein n=1 Tax=Hymenoscyphus albidus TaxID=595503 RepID=A0A9N9LVT7_9HELO|nr:hypothetical protein HYALB_00002470 [Hymenoscyphus albidus]
MNWTGGAKQRHSNAAGSLKHRQQQHFAKVKANPLAGKKQSPRKHPNVDRLRQLHEGNSRPRQPSAAIIDPRESHTYDDRNTSQRHTQSDPFKVHPATFGEPKNTHFLASQQHHPTTIKREKSSRAGFHPPTFQSRVEVMEYQRDSVSVASGGFDHEAEGSLMEKRRKILLKGDWVCVGFQRPPQVENISSQIKHDVARRRKVRDGHRARYNNEPQSHFPIRDHEYRHQQKPRETHEHMPRNTGQPGVRISIGGKLTAPGLSSSSAVPRSIQSQSSQRFSSNRQPSYSSDVMLLDNEKMRSGSMSSRGLSNVQLANERRATPEEQRQPIFCPSSASLVHPVPRSTRVAPILRRESVERDAADSTIAQVGRNRPIVPSSEVLDNSIWETWMEAMNPEDNSNTESTTDNQNVHISPGVSAAPTYGPRYDITEVAGMDHFDEFSTDLGPFKPVDIPRELSDSRDEKNNTNGYSIDDQSEIPSYFGEGAEAYTESDILDVNSASGGYTEESRQDFKLMTHSAPSSSPTSYRRFKMPSPLPELASDEDNVSSPSISHSPNHKGHTVTGSPIFNQRINLKQQEPELTQQNDTGAMWNALAKALEPPVLEESAADDVWRKFVFGSEGEDVDIFGQQVTLGASSLGPSRGSSVMVQQPSSNFDSHGVPPNTTSPSRLFPLEQPTTSLSDYRMEDYGSSYLEPDEWTYSVGTRTDCATKGGSASLAAVEVVSSATSNAFRTTLGGGTDFSTTQTDRRTFTTSSPLQRPTKKVMFTKPTPFSSSLTEAS